MSRFDAGEPTECHCSCHTNFGITHYAPCCTVCDRCQRRFLAGMKKHRESCANGDAR